MITNIIVATVTAYCAGKCCCPPTSKGLTANGNKPIQGITIAGPRIYPFESIVYIKGQGRFILQDRLAKRYDSRFDIYYSSHAEAKQFGIKTNQTIKVILK